MVDRVIASSILALITSVGLISNAFALYAIYRYKHLHNTFGTLCALLAASNFCESFIHLLWSAYGPYLFDESTISGLPGKIVGQISIFFLDLKVYAHFGVSINRLFSLTFPLKVYLPYFTSEDFEGLVNVISWISCILSADICNREECYCTYYSDFAIWDYGDTACNRFYLFYIEFILSICVYCCIIVLDTISILILRKVLDTSNWNYTFKEKRKLEIGFFIQSLYQIVLLLLAYVSYFFLSRYATNDWMLFGTTTVVWALLHTVDGVIMAVFQARKVLNRWQARVKPASSTNGVSTVNIRIGGADSVMQQ